MVLTGAGISAGSGIPTYRDINGIWQRNQPVQHQDFVNSPAARRRYWQRSFAGWPLMSVAEPTDSHFALACLESSGLVPLLVTQNVDRLHQRAGHRNVIDLHGRVDEIICLSCHALLSRNTMQDRLKSMNPSLELKGIAAPDGDAEVELVEGFQVPDCDHCNGILMPNVVFFGGSVNRARVDEIKAAILAADALMVVGSSLQVFSGYRFCRYAFDHNIPIMSVNPGKTRADDLFSVRVPAPSDEVLPFLAQKLTAQGF